MNPSIGTVPQHPYERLEVWRRAHEATLRVYHLTDQFPARERYELAAQLRRAAVSIPANLAEGNARGTIRQYLQFCDVARGSLAEVRYLLRLCRDRNLVDEQTHTELLCEYDSVGKMLHFLMVSLRRHL